MLFSEKPSSLNRAMLALLAHSLFALLLAAAQASGQTTATLRSAPFDVIDYDAQIEPDIANKTVMGKVLIRLVIRADNLAAIELNCGDLTIDRAREGDKELKFAREEHRVLITPARRLRANETREIEIEYHGAPRFGIRFFPEQQQVYTVFSTSQWMVCVDVPEDKATLRLKLILPSNLRAVANGRLVSQRALPNQKIICEWRQKKPVSTYIFGFAAGQFQTRADKIGRVELRYLFAHFSDAEIVRIFKDTADMLRFYEDRAGVPYADAVYTQVLAQGGVEQEMSGFTVMRETYGREALADERALWLAAHEFAHQWWGNMVTCVDWRHFWLNEGIATFMAAAYKEHRFGRAEYMAEIEESRKRYEKVRDAGKDRSLVFPDWDHPTPADRTLVYHKGAYALHLLREQMGEQAFWAGLRLYTRTYFGKSVVTEDFQRAMEQASGKKLTDFFARWIYLSKQ
jgi:aminopeptidase N